MIIRSLRPVSARVSSARHVPLNTLIRRRRQSSIPPRPPQDQPPDPPEAEHPEQAISSRPSVESALATTDPSRNNLLAPVHIPEDPNAVLNSTHPTTGILAQSALVVQRQIEMMNLFLGFEQANRYVIMDPHGGHVGYMAEHDGGFGKAFGRQMFRTHRSFVANIFDRHGKEVLRVSAGCGPVHVEGHIPADRTVNSSIAPSPGSSPGFVSTIHFNLPP